MARPAKAAKKSTSEGKDKVYSLKKVFSDGVRIVGLTGNTNSGKTNCLVSMLIEFRQYNPQTEIYCFGFNDLNMEFLKEKINAHEISTVKQLVDKKNCLIVIDEAQRLGLTDRRNKEETEEFRNFVFHNNVYAVISSPDIRSFNSTLCGIIERYIVKSISLDNCVNGSSLKKAVTAYRGRHRVLGDLVVPKEKIIILGTSEEITLECDYISEIDGKRDQFAVFS